MRVLAIVGARPQFIKAAPFAKALTLAGHRPVLLHTGQHYDHEMSQIFFDQLGLMAPVHNLGVGSGGHADQVGKMLAGIDRFLAGEQFDRVVVFGDTNSTLAGALAASMRQLPLAHVEAGVRSFNRAMPEERNRVLTDHCCDFLFCPTQTAMDNLAREGLLDISHLCGDIMYDALKAFAPLAEQKSDILSELGLKPEGYYLATVHRAANTDDPENLRQICRALLSLDKPVAFPVHPRTRKLLEDILGGVGNSSRLNKLHIIPPVGYLDALCLQKNAFMVLTDSGGMQKEAYMLKTPCLTLRDETEWPETLRHGWNRLVGVDADNIVAAAKKPETFFGEPRHVFGDGDAAEKILRILEQY